MKLILGHLINFGSMFGLAFTFCAAVLSSIPLLGAFIWWDVSIITNVGWETVSYFARISIACATIMGLWFTFSKEGQLAAKEFVEGK